MKRLGYIGLGIMGRPMAANLLAAGFELTVWNRTRSRADDLLSRGAAWVDSPANLAERTDAVCINVTDTADVEHVIFGDHGIAGGAREGLLVIDHSTIRPAATRDFAERLRAHGAELLDAPVSGGDSGARAGTLSIMVGGDERAFHRCRPIFEAVGKSITHMGPSGSGQACKAANQVLAAVNLLAVCEAMALAVREDLDLEKMLHVTGAGAGGSWTLSNLGPRIAAGDLSPGFMVELINKDLSIVYHEASRLRLAMPATGLAAELFRAAEAAGHGRDGTQALCRVLEMLGGFTYHPSEE